MPRGNLRGAERHARFTLRGELGAASEILRSLWTTAQASAGAWRRGGSRGAGHVWRRPSCASRAAAPRLAANGGSSAGQGAARPMFLGLALFSSFVRSPMLTGTAPYAGVCDARRARHVQDTARAAAAPRREALLVRAFEPANTMCPVFAFFISPERAACHECDAGSKKCAKACVWPRLTARGFYPCPCRPTGWWDAARASSSWAPALTGWRWAPRGLAAWTRASCSATSSARRSGRALQ